MSNINRLDENVILALHDQQISKFGGEYGIIDENVFLSQCYMPYQTFGGEDLFPDVYDKAVRYLFGFATNQVFRDGNKRTAAITTLVFLHFNGIDLDITSEDLSSITLNVANKLLNEGQVKQFLIEHTITY